MADDDGEKTQPATARRLERAREMGQVPLSREVPGLVGLGAATLMLIMAGPEASRTLTEALAGLLARADALDPIAALHAAALAGAMAVAPLAFAVLAASVTSTLLQTGFLFRFEALLPDPARLDPRRGLSRVFGVSALVEQGKALVKIGVLGYTAWRVLTGALPMLDGAVLWMPVQLADSLLRQILHLMLMMLAAQAVIAGADVAWVRYRHSSGLRMTREEVKQEGRETDGNPQIKARLRQIRRARAKQRMMAAVPAATVVVTNPTHYAIALAYDRGKRGAPRVVAKGVDEVAARIREVAQDNRVPIVANPPLARALYTVDLDAEIPAEHFKAVAEIIAYVWRLRGRGR